MAVNRFYSSTAAETTLTAGINNSVTTISVAATTGFPTSFPYTLAIDYGTSSEELVEVTSAAGLNLTVTRGVDGTSGVSHNNGATVSHRASARDFREPQEHIDNTTTAHGVTGAVVGTTNTQTLTNKTLTLPTIGDLTNAQHAHAAASSGGLLGTAAPTASAVGDASVTGTATTYSRTDHKHAREAFGSVTAATSYGLSSSDGAATTVSRSDHTHGSVSFSSIATRCTTTTSTTDAVAFSVPTGFASFTISANKFYSYVYVLVYETAVSTTGITVRIAQTATHDEGGMVLLGATGSTALIAAADSSAAGGDVTYALTGSAGTQDMPLVIQGFVDSGASGGTLTLDFRSEVGGSSVSINEGSYGVITECSVI